MTEEEQTVEKSISEEIFSLLTAEEKASLTTEAAAIICDILSGRDVVIQTSINSNKMMTFMIPILEKLHRSDNDRCLEKNPKIIILEPNADGVRDVRNFIDTHKLEKSISKKLSKGSPLHVCTPEELGTTSTWDLSQVQLVILDDFDTVIDMAYGTTLPVEFVKICRNPGTQIALYTTRMPPWVFTMCSKNAVDRTLTRISTSMESEVCETHRKLDRSVNGTYQVQNINTRQIAKVMIQRCGNEAFAGEDDNVVADERRLLQALIEEIKNHKKYMDSAQINIFTKYGSVIVIESGKAKHKFTFQMDCKDRVHMDKMRY